MIQNRLEHTVDVGEYIVVPESHHGKTAALEEMRAQLILLDLI